MVFLFTKPITTFFLSSSSLPIDCDKNKCQRRQHHRRDGQMRRFSGRRRGIRLRLLSGDDFNVEMNFLRRVNRDAADVSSGVARCDFLDRQKVSDDRAVALLDVDDIQVSLVDAGVQVITDFEDRGKIIRLVTFVFHLPYQLKNKIVKCQLYNNFYLISQSNSFRFNFAKEGRDLMGNF